MALAPRAGAVLASHGATLAAAGRLREAVRTLSAAVARRPGDAVSLRNLGQALTALGDPAAALLPLEQATALAPSDPAPWLALAHAQRELGATGEAARAAEAALHHADPGSALAAQARFLLAALGRAPVPERAPAAYVRDLFDGFAPRFEAELTAALDYRTPALLADLLREAGVPATGGLRVLDLGCGTGLSGVALAPFAARLEGLDLSPRMLAEAAKRQGLYAALHEADLLDFLPAHPGAFDLIVAADVLNYLGDLAPALEGLAAALVPGGVAAFSVEAGEASPFVLAEGMRYRHAPAHVAALAKAAGFAIAAQAAAVLRREKGAPVEGALLVLRKPAVTG